VALVLALGVGTAVFAGPEPERSPSVLVIEGMEPISAADLTRFTGLAVRLAAASKNDPAVRPLLVDTLSQSDRGLVKRAIAYLALCAMGEEPMARSQLVDSFRDRAMMKIVRACLAEADGLTRLAR
jgi:hypothetical protein